MPVFMRRPFSGGQWEGDALDQADQFNANRQDQAARYAHDMEQNNTANDLRSQQALAMLKMQNMQYLGNREDSAADRRAKSEELKAKYDFQNKELGIRQADAEENRNWNHIQRQDLFDQMEERKAKRATRQKFHDTFDPTAYGITDPRAIAALNAANAGGNEDIMGTIIGGQLTRGLDAQNRPEERKIKGEDLRGQMAAQQIAALGGAGDLNPRQMQQYSQAVGEYAKQGYGDVPTQSPQVIKAQEYAKQEARAIVKKADELAGGMFGIATQADIDTVAQQAEDLADTMSKVGYKPEEINAVMADIQAKLEKVNANDFTTPRR